jgi:hypothetical protein
MDYYLSEYFPSALEILKIEEKELYLDKGVSDLKRIIRDKYDDYSFDGIQNVYNPISILNFFLPDD